METWCCKNIYAVLFNAGVAGNEKMNGNEQQIRIKAGYAY